MDPSLPDRHKIEAETALFLARVKELTDKGWDAEKARRVAILEHPWAEDPGRPGPRTGWWAAMNAPMHEVLARYVLPKLFIGLIALAVIAVVSLVIRAASR